MSFSRRDILLAGSAGLAGLGWPGGVARAGAAGAPTRVHVNRGYGISTNHPLATRAARAARQAGGGAFDMLVAAIAASWVADPANSSPFGRIQGVNSSGTGSWTLHAATRIRALADSTVPVPGNVSAIYHFKSSGLLRLPMSRILKPAIEAAAHGFAASEALRAIVAQTADDLSPELRRIYLDGSGAPRETVANPAIAHLLRTMAASHDERAFWRSLSAGGGGAWSESELLDNAAGRGEGRGFAITSSAGEEYLLQTTDNLETWGSWTLLGAAIASALRRKAALTRAERAHEAYVLASILLLDRVPFAVGTLVPKVPRPSVEFDIATEADAISDRVIALLDSPREALWAALANTYFGDEASITDDRNTTHFSIADGDQFLSYTTSIGPWFGSKREWHGAALGYSYAMRSGQRFEGQTHDVTELSPVTILRGGQPWLAMGAAGSERILGALTWILFLKFGMELPHAAADLMAMPRLFPKDGKIRIHVDFPAASRAHLLARGFTLDPTDYRIGRHLGIVNLVERVGGSAFKSGADPSSNGAAF